MANYLDETGLQTLHTRIEAVYKRRDDMIGTVMWWSGSISSIPSNAKICNGQSLSSTTYATLYARIGTTYGGDSTNFALPDLRTSSDYGRFVRARFKDIGSGEGQITLANITQEDAIRNITGQVSSSARVGSTSSAAGTCSSQGSFTGSTAAGSTAVYCNRGNYWLGGSGYYIFDSNKGSSSNNPMYGHANGNDIHPYNISMVPIIIVS